MKGEIEKRCPECGALLKPTHPKRTSTKGVIMFYRRNTCSSNCGFYEARPRSQKWVSGSKLSLTEKEEIENNKAERFFPKDYVLLKKQAKI